MAIEDNRGKVVEGGPFAYMARSLIMHVIYSNQKNRESPRLDKPPQKLQRRLWCLRFISPGLSPLPLFFTRALTRAFCGPATSVGNGVGVAEASGAVLFVLGQRPQVLVCLALFAHLESKVGLFLQWCDLIQREMAGNV